MHGSITASQQAPFACKLMNPAATGKDHKRAARAALSFAGRTVAAAIESQSRLVFNIAGTVGGAVGGALGAAGGFIKGCYHKTVNASSEAGKKPLSEYMVNAARSGYLKGDQAGRWTALATSPVLGSLAVLTGGIAGTAIATASSPIVYLQARDNSHGRSDMADFVSDCFNRMNNQFQDMNQAIKTGETKKARKTREEKELYKHFDLSYNFEPLYQVSEL